MHILLIADGRSPITQRWIQGLLALQHHVSLVSTFPCLPIPDVDTVHILPIAFSDMGGSQAGLGSKKNHYKVNIHRIVRLYRPILQTIRNSLGPLTIPLFARRLRIIIEKCKPDLVHALRIPYEGMIASYTPKEIPLVISSWGNDLTFHALTSSLMHSFTKRAMQRTNGLIVDATRDLRLSYQWGFNPAFPSLIVPTCGGINLEEINRLRQNKSNMPSRMLPDDIPLVVNPRGLRPGYVRNDTFFQAIPLLLERWQKVHFICPSMAGQPEALRWIQRLKISNHVSLLPYLSQTELWELFLRAQISTSITVHDGTPNTLLEAMALNCFPIVGDIESLREWIVPGVNGLLVDPDRPQALAEALLFALERHELRQRAAEINLEIVRERAEINYIRTQTEIFYQSIISKFSKEN